MEGAAGAWQCLLKQAQFGKEGGSQGSPMLGHNDKSEMGTIFVMVGNSDTGGGERAGSIKQHNDKDKNFMMASAAMRVAALNCEAKVIAMGLRSPVDRGVQNQVKE